MTGRRAWRRRTGPGDLVDGFELPREVHAAGGNWVAEGLRDWLHVCAASTASTFVVLPSNAVGAAWDALISSGAWERFTEDVLGGEHAYRASARDLPAEQRAGGLWRTWAVVCRRDGIDARRPDRLPRLFGVDEDVGSPTAICWELVDGRVPFRRSRGPEPATACAFAPSPDEKLIYVPWGLPPDLRD